ncbi:hypothetical protein BOW53_01565 [Solemya pervernicosa gill symbiont]|uniref:Peptidoglycan-binding protein CsiV n=2 Tax=Gammaproteobacteria incertae sedis TaxID=118884 RepID=A0A1T2LAB8_9GAMM|nr:CsiV family protein [Candidatus Reidiella endopervernicosa]OOZ42049.1 hypothetical protein BOW53_01565 [Solemya pervernicosa gill symbiont]QKQ27002.1 peptidoglycan binding protein CsiV [Candidatus Reidiella endopervernicosa]
MSIFRSTVGALFAATLLSLLSLRCAFAEEEEPRWYQIEVILFEQTSAGRGVGEVFPINPGMPDITRALPMLEAETVEFGEGGQLPYQQVADDSLLLIKKRDSLGRSQGFRPLLHTAWTQPVLAASEAQPVRLISPTEDQNNRIVGTLRVTLSRYLHVESDLLYIVGGKEEGAVGEFGAKPLVMESAPIESDYSTLEANESDYAAEAIVLSGERFRMKQKRRLRSKELHYFDHPRFGMLIQITPVEAKEETEL